MNDRRTGERVFWLLGISACFAPGARAAQPIVIVPGSTAPAAESPLERVYRLKYLSTEPAVPDLPETSSAAPASDAPVPVSSRVTVDAAAIASTIGLNPQDAVEKAKSSVTGEIPIHPALTDRFFIGLGAFYPSSTTDARLNSPSGLGTTINFEDTLGLDNSDIVPTGLARWRMSDRWRLELEHFGLNRSNTATLNSDVIWGDQVFPSGSQVDARYDVAITRLSAGYSFFKTPDKEVGIALGFHVTSIEAELAGSGGGGSDTGKVLAPLPVISMYGQVALTDKWAIASRLDAFRLAYEPYEGHVFALGIDVLYQPWRHLGLGLGWRSLEMEVSASKSDWEGALRSVFQGPMAFISTSF
jgi:hypothetical protein